VDQFKVTLQFLSNVTYGIISNGGEVKNGYVNYKIKASNLSVVIAYAVYGALPHSVRGDTDNEVNWSISVPVKECLEALGIDTQSHALHHKKKPSLWSEQQNPDQMHTVEHEAQLSEAAIKKKIFDYLKLKLICRKLRLKTDGNPSIKTMEASNDLETQGYVKNGVATYYIKASHINVVLTNSQKGSADDIECMISEPVDQCLAALGYQQPQANMRFGM